MSEEKSSGGPIGRGGGLGQKSEKAKNFKGTMLHLAGYLKHYKISVIVVILFACCSSVFSIVGPKVLGKATTKLFEGLMAWAMGTGLLTDFRYIRNRLLLLVVLYLVSALFSYLQSYIMSGVSMKITYELRKNISEKMNRLPLNYYDTRTHGEILSRITNDVDTVSQTLNQSLTQMITSVTTLIGIVAMMLSISIRMTLVAVLVLFISMGLIVTVVKKSQKYFSQQQKSLGNLNGHIEEIYAGHNVVQIFNGEKEAIEKFRLINDKLYGSAWKSQFLSGMMMPIMSFVGNLDGEKGN